MADTRPGARVFVSVGAGTHYGKLCRTRGSVYVSPEEHEDGQSFLAIAAAGDETLSSISVPGGSERLQQPRVSGIMGANTGDSGSDENTPVPELASFALLGADPR